MLQDLLKPVNDGVERREKLTATFEAFVESVYIPVFERKWKPSTAENETNRIRVHLVRSFGEKLVRDIKREELRELLDRLALKSNEAAPQTDEMYFV
ncbi:MAG: hypothetical protein ACJ746_26765 [Bryobacteraceae bacterium]